ncbi:hypothetical protein P4S70_14775 [Enterovibrio sp. Hal110]
MLKLVADNPENNDKQAAGEHIRQYAPAFAAEVVRFIIRQSDYDELKESVKQQFLDWWQLSLPSGPLRISTNRFTGTSFTSSNLDKSMS